MTDLINRYFAKDYLHITSNEDDGLLDTLVSAASKIVENICDRVFATTPYTEWLDGNGQNYILVPHYPITEIERVCLGSVVALEVQCSQSDATRAVVSYDKINVDCKIVGGAEDGKTNSAAVATYKTLSTLDTQIDTFTGWAATIRHTDSGWASADIRPVSGLNALSPLYAQLLVPGDAVTWIDDDGIRTIYLSSAVSRGRKNVFVEWTGGYTSIPEPIEVVCAKIVGDLYAEGKRDSTLKSERLGDYAWVAKVEKEVAMNYFSELRPYMKIGMA